MMAISSISKITNKMEIIKNWFENFIFFSDRELNPHSILLGEIKLDLNFCFIKNIRKKIKIEIKIDRKICIFEKISEWINNSILLYQNK